MERYEDFEALLDESPADGSSFGLEAHSDPPGQRAPDPVADWARPHRLSRELERALWGIGERFALSVGPALSGSLRSACAMRLDDVRPARVADLRAQLPRPSCLAVTSLLPRRGSAWVALDPGLASTLVTRLLGGQVEESGALRELTLLDRSLASHLMAILMAHLRQAAAGIVDLAPSVQRIETSPDRLQGIDDQETVVSLCATLSVQRVEGAFDVHLPLAAFEPAAPGPDPRSETRFKPRCASDRGLEAALQHAEVWVGARLRSTCATMAEIAALVPDSLLRLGHPHDRAVEVDVEGRTLWSGVVGERAGLRTVRIVEELEEA